jgi:hypothetical protein
VVFLPALCLAGAALVILQQVDQILTQIDPIVIQVLGREIARIDLLEILRLSGVAQSVGALVKNQAGTFLLLAFLAVIGLGGMLLIVWLLLIAGYNLLASSGRGLEVELQEKAAPGE